ncbi:MAG: glycosyltransferase [Nitrospirota bacterium]
MIPGNSGKKVVFWVEVSRQTGMGHLMESLTLAGHLTDRNTFVHFIINPYSPAEELLSVKGFPFTTYEHAVLNDVVGSIRNLKAGCVLINHRYVSLDALRRLRQENIRTVVIDQMGNKTVACDLLINRSITKSWLTYEFTGQKPECCFGVEYALLAPGYQKLHSREKEFSARQGGKVLVTMGGVDRTGATLRIIEALRPLDNISREIVLGSGFPHMEELRKLQGKIGSSAFSFHQGVDDLGDRMRSADIVISAGGNTVYEMACVGTPGIVLWEDEHEYVQARDFEEKGVLYCLGNGITTPVEGITEAVTSMLNNVEQRKSMSRLGKELVDAEGTERVGSRIIGLL